MIDIAWEHAAVVNRSRAQAAREEIESMNGHTRVPWDWGERTPRPVSIYSLTLTPAHTE